MLRIDEEKTSQTLQKEELPAQAVRALEPKNASNSFEDEENEPDNFATLKAQAWGRMVPGQIGLHLSELREQAEKLRLPEAASPSLAIRVLHYHCDHLGTPRELTDESGKLAWSAEYMAWGKLKRLQGRAGGSADAAGAGVPPDQFWHTRTQPGRSNHLPEWVADNAGSLKRWRELKDAEEPQNTPEAANDPSVWGEPTDQSIRFQGQWHDPETGLHYNRFRYYDPDVGRFIHQDPIGLLGGFNTYRYGPNPTTWVDIFGLKGAYIFEVINNPTGDTYIGKGPWSRYLGSTRQRGGGKGAPDVSRGAHIDVKSPCTSVSDSDYAFIVEDTAMTIYKTLHNPSVKYLNAATSPGRKKLALLSVKCPILATRATADANALIGKMMEKPLGSGRF